MDIMKKKWSNPAFMSFICGLLGWWIVLTQAWEHIQGIVKASSPGTIDRLIIMGFILVCFLAILLGIRGIRQVNLNPDLSGKFFAILGILLSGLAVLCGPILIIIIFNYYHLKLVIG